MTITAGVLSQVSVGSTTADLLATVATGGTGPYTYQWYRSITTGFSPGPGNLVAGATALSLHDTGLTPGTQYYYSMIATDTGHSNDTVTYSQLTISVTLAPTQNPNQFAQSAILGMIDLRFPYNTVSVQIAASQASPCYAGQAVKMVDSADGIPKVVSCAANTDEVLGFINYDIKSRAFLAGDTAEISMAGNVIYLYAVAAIARGAQVSLDLSTRGGVAVATSPNRIVGWAYDKAVVAGQLIRVFLKTPSFTVAT